MGANLLDLLFGPRSPASLRPEAEAIRALPDRRVLIDRYLPAFARLGGRILWVGVRDYTAPDYAVLEAQGAEVWTTDISRSAARWGRAGRHRKGDVCEAGRVFPGFSFRSIMLNGVLGWGVDAPEAQARALSELASLLEPGGRLMVGWNHDRMADPLTTGVIPQALEAAGLDDLPPRLEVEGTTHVYDLWRRSEG